jgi:hypothetical protein
VIYQQLLGPEWDLLDPNVRQLHSGDGPWNAVGAFAVKHGTTRLARILIRAGSLPAAGADVAVRLEVTEQSNCEIWRRWFAGKAFITRQRRGRSNLLIEDMGALRVHYQLTVVAGALLYRQVSAALHLGGPRLRLPGWVVPQISAREWSEGNGQWISVRVRAFHRICGLVIEYEGKIRLTCSCQ